MFFGLLLMYSQSQIATARRAQGQRNLERKKQEGASTPQPIRMAPPGNGQSQAPTSPSPFQVAP